MRFLWFLEVSDWDGLPNRRDKRRVLYFHIIYLTNIWDIALKFLNFGNWMLYLSQIIFSKLNAKHGKNKWIKLPTNLFNTFIVAESIKMVQVHSSWLPMPSIERNTQTNFTNRKWSAWTGPVCINWHAIRTYTYKTCRHQLNTSLYAIHIGSVHSAAIAAANFNRFFQQKTVSDFQKSAFISLE